jgi:translation initiation factor 1
MAKNKKRRIDTDGMVYSTDPDFEFGNEISDDTDLSPEEQSIVLRKDKKNRKGKLVTLVQGFRGSNEKLKELARELKSVCGTGGSAKDGEIVIQGDFIDKINAHLIRSGYNVKKLH